MKTLVEYLQCKTEEDYKAIFGGDGALAYNFLRDVNKYGLLAFTALPSTYQYKLTEQYVFVYRPA